MEDKNLSKVLYTLVWDIANSGNIQSLKKELIARIANIIESIPESGGITQQSVEQYVDQAISEVVGDINQQLLEIGKL